MKLESVKKILESKIKNELAFAVPEANLYKISFNFHEIWRGFTLGELKKVFTKLAVDKCIQNFSIEKDRSLGFWADKITIELNQKQALIFKPTIYVYDSEKSEFGNGTFIIKLKPKTKYLKFIELLSSQRSHPFTYEQIASSVYGILDTRVTETIKKNIREIERYITKRLKQKGETHSPFESGNGYRLK